MAATRAVRLFRHAPQVTALLLLAACAGKPLEAMLKPPAPLEGFPEINSLYRREEVFISGLYEQYQRHAQAMQAVKQPAAHNVECAALLEKEIRAFPWTGHASQFEEDKRRITLNLARAHCDRLHPTQAARGLVEKPLTVLDAEQARKFATIDDFLQQYVASEYSEDEKRGVNWQDMRDNDIYLYRAYVPGKDMAQVLLWPRNALEAYCTSQGGRFLELAYADSQSLEARAPTANEAAGLHRALEKNALGRKFCVSDKVLLWGVFLGPGRVSGRLPTDLREDYLPPEQRTYTSEMTIHINAGMYYEQRGAPYEDLLQAAP